MLVVGVTVQIEMEADDLMSTPLERAKQRRTERNKTKISLCLFIGLSDIW